MPLKPIEDGSGAPTGIECRRYARHRFIVDLNISKENGMAMHGMSFDIGAGGMAAATSGRLEVGDQVILYPVIHVRVKATVRRRNGSMYGFEFLAPTPEFQQQILALCEILPSSKPWPTFEQRVVRLRSKVMISALVRRMISLRLCSLCEQ
jgi:PilZ domain